MRFLKNSLDYQVNMEAFHEMDNGLRWMAS